MLTSFKWSSDFVNTLNHCMLTIHYSDAIMSTMASQITGVYIVYWTVCSSPDQRKHQRSASLAFVRGIHWWPVNSPHKGPVTRKMFPFDGVIMISSQRPASRPVREKDLRYGWKYPFSFVGLDNDFVHCLLDWSEPYLSQASPPASSCAVDPYTGIWR